MPSVPQESPIDRRPRWEDEVRAAYVHVPFCRHRCGYCDFTLVAGRDDLIDDYLAALSLDLEQLSDPHVVETLFLGGGTPTHLPPSRLERLLRLLAEWLPLATGGEFSVEANPSGLDGERIDLLAEAGVNRVSLGVQSFDDRHLATLERDHRAEQIANVIRRLRRRFENISVDLIFAVPGQTVWEWDMTLQAAVELAPRHISTYGLTWEKGTAYWSRRRRGELRPLEEEDERRMYELSMDRLVEAGYEHYELSNFARPGYRCRHNQTYWNAEAYYGFGPGAASYLRGVRRLNHRSTTTWIRRVLSGERAVVEEERLGADEAAREAIMLGLRQREGIRLDEFERRFGTTPAALEPAAHARSLDAGVLEQVDGRLRLTREGCFVADQVMSEFL